MLSHNEVATFLLHLAKAIPTFAPDLNDQEVISIWHGVLKGYALDDLRKAYKVLLHSEKQFPPIARVLAIVGASNRETFEDLWALIGKHGGYRPPQNVSYAMAMTINRMGGWQAICDWTNDDKPFRKKDFDETYSGVTDMLAVVDHACLAPITIKGIHTSSESRPIAKTSTPALTAAEAIAQDPTKKEIDWDAICAAHTTGVGDNRKSDVDLNLPIHLKEKGFFKLYSKPGYYKYCFGAIPGKGWPHSFVDVDEHLKSVRDKRASEPFIDPNKFDPSRYTADRYTE